MHSKNLLSLAVGLLRLDLAIAGHCRGRTSGVSSRTSASTTSVLAIESTSLSTETETVELTSSALETTFLTSTLLTTTIASEISSSSNRASIDLISSSDERETSNLPSETTELTTSKLETNFSTSILPTTTVASEISSSSDRASIDPNSSSTENEISDLPSQTTDSATSEPQISLSSTTDSPITTIETITEPTLTTTIESTLDVSSSVESSTSSSPPPTVPTAFNLVPSTGPVAGYVLQGRNSGGSYMLLNAYYLTNASISYEADTGYLHPFSNVLICVGYNLNSNTASLQTCTSGSESRPLLTCEPPTGPTLKCSVPACHYEGETVWGQPGTDNEGMSWTSYTLVCDPEAEPWSNFYNADYEGGSDGEWKINIGPEGATGDNTLVPIEVLVEAL